MPRTCSSLQVLFLPPWARSLIYGLDRSTRGSLGATESCLVLRRPHRGMLIPPPSPAGLPPGGLDPSTFGSARLQTGVSAVSSQSHWSSSDNSRTPGTRDAMFIAWSRVDLAVGDSSNLHATTLAGDVQIREVLQAQQSDCFRHGSDQIRIRPSHRPDQI